MLSEFLASLAKIKSSTQKKTTTDHPENRCMNSKTSCCLKRSFGYAPIMIARRRIKTIYMRVNVWGVLTPGNRDFRKFRVAITVNPMYHIAAATPQPLWTPP